MGCHTHTTPETDLEQIFQARQKPIRKWPLAKVISVNSAHGNEGKEVETKTTTDTNISRCVLPIGTATMLVAK
jgi:hypothetical protein